MIRLVLALAVLARLAIPAAGQGARQPMPEIQIEQRLDEVVPLDLLFRTESSAAVKLRDLVDGKPFVLVLAYYRCPSLCSLVLNGLADSLRRLNLEVGEAFCVVTVSIDPNETPQQAAAKKAIYVDYCGRAGAATGWHFLTGDEAAIRTLAQAVGFRYRFDPRTGEYAHGSGILIVTPEGKIARYLFGINYAPRDLRFALEDASAGRIGSPVLRPLRLLCFGYDPQTGSYTLMTLRLVRLGGLLTVLVLAGFIVWQVRRDRHKRRTAEAQAAAVRGG
jgi:protein SCO1/2